MPASWSALIGGARSPQLVCPRSRTVRRLLVCVAGTGLALLLGLACEGRRAPPRFGPVDDCDRCVGDGDVCTSVYDQTWCLPSCVDDCDCPNGTLCEPSTDGSVKMCITFAGDMACTTCDDDQLCVWGDAIDLVACADVCDPSRADCATGLFCQPIGIGRPAVCVDPVVAADVNLTAFNRANNIGRVCGGECGGCPEGTACIKAHDAIGGSLPSVDGGTFRQVFRCVEQCVVDPECPDGSTCEQVNPDTGFDALCAPSDPAWDYP